MVAGSGPGSGPRAGKDLTRDLARDRAWLLATDLNNTSRFGEYHTGKIRRKTNRKLGTWYGCWSGIWLGTSSREGPGQKPGSDLARGLAWLLARDLEMGENVRSDGRQCAVVQKCAKVNVCGIGRAHRALQNPPKLRSCKFRIRSV